MEQFAMQALRGAVLSDGGLRLNGKNALFYINLSDNKNNLVQREHIPIEELLNFLQHLVETLEPLGIKPCNGHPRIKPHSTKSRVGEWLPGVMLETLTSGLLTKLHSEYYPIGKKIVPEGVALTDVILAYFYMLDDNSKWGRSGGPTIYVYLYTQGFDLHSVELLEKQLHNSDISTSRMYVLVEGGSGVVIRILQDSVDRFMGMVDPYVIPPFRYKIKYRGSCPPKLAIGYREHNRKYMREYMREYYKGRKYHGSKTKQDLLAKINSVRCMIR